MPFLLLVLNILLSACSQNATLPPTNNAPQSPSSKAIEKRKEWLKDLASLSSASNSTLAFDVLRYNVQLEYMPGLSEARLRGHVDVQMRALQTLKQITLNSKVEALHKIENAQGQPLNFSYVRDSREVTIELTNAIQAQEEFSLRIFYTTLANDALGSGLYFYKPNETEDPNPHPMLYTKTEPQGTMGWLPSQDRPDDRASFALEITLPRELSLVTNGLLVKDQFSDSSRTMKWETQIPIPTYLMAFAISKFQHTSQWHDGLELSIWSRQGLPVDAHALLEETRRQIALFESLMVPYPFEKYFIVLIPDFRGGMEHASVTFNDEGSSTVADNHWDRYLMAHELGHQWFGDLVTIRSWDDLWIKEGMASLLAYEAMRSSEGLRQKDSALGEFFWFEKGEAILDPSLPPNRKYTSGPYDRAAWWLTQLREVVGVKTFWMQLKKILQDYRFQAIGSDEFLSYFEAHMSPEQMDRFAKALLARDVPRLQFSDRKASADAGALNITLHDPEGALVLPFEMDLVSDNTSRQTLGLVHGESLSLVSPSSERLVLDPQDRHPSIWAFVPESQEDKELRAWVFEAFVARQVPASESQWQLWMADTGWANRLGALKALSYYPVEALAPFIQSEELLSMIQKSQSAIHKSLLIDLTCRKSSTPTPALNKFLRSLSLVGLVWFGKDDLSSCAAHADLALPGLKDKVIFDERPSALSDREALVLESFFSLKSPENLQLWSEMNKKGDTLRQRRMAQRFLRTDSK